MTYQEARKSTIQERFNKFHHDNPVVYSMIKKEVLNLFKKGAKKVSIKRVINDIRWDMFFITKEPTLFEPGGATRKFKIDDAFTSRYNRLFVQEFPQYAQQIEQRKLRSL